MQKLSPGLQNEVNMVTHHRKVLIGSILVLLTFFSLVFALTDPKYKYQFNSEIRKFSYDLTNGERIFYASGCGSCHLDPSASDPDLILAGGLALKTDFGTFYSPNISPDVNFGIGSWSISEFADAIKNGLNPEGAHYFPSFPYTSYQGMSNADLVDLYYFIMSLIPSEKPNKPHELHFPFSFRASVGIWKHLYFYPNKMKSSKDTKGKYLVETLGHCAECHTPRTFLGGLDKKKSLAGAKSIKNEGAAPNITPHQTGIANWTVDDIANYLETGFTPDFDSAGSQMVSVISNLSKIPKQDLVEIAIYLKSVEPIASN